ncbi:site-specific DNA-methyltransferase [Campylobacter concisus]|uniref:site-specific DNA-methyltransferase n=1 Tax=Campylobacter concisus TaxID=199 RepID=UPI00122CC2E6|nr:site-specific DNA-methyltransferase [Campylobacter concisus]MBE9836449.1 site-specific DNA-methyltransferase [Campylobacter concisus]MBE9857287.1 site-specific DNA-methyltransferase [Campylobacter concisus]
MDKMRMETADITAQNIEKIGAMFPNCITEMLDEEKSTAENNVYKKAVNFELLKQMLSKDVIEGNEAYEFTWVGKKASIIEANKPIRKTLRPCKEESVNWDKTENLYIEGDNLEVLKLLQESYLGKVKMIYIDPPYNTGNDFIYNDDFKMSSDEYADKSGEIDEVGNRMFKNTDSNGRFHSDWCSMIYPRLMLARNLLSDDGVIFISIDDNEQANLKKICDEVFGAGNYITNFVWEKGKEGGNDSSIMRSHYENIICYCKDSNIKGIINLDQKDKSRHIKLDKEENLVKGIKIDKNKGELFQLINLSKQKDYLVNIPLLDGTIIKWNSYAPQTTINEWIKIGKLFVGKTRVPYVKSFLKDELQGQKPSNIITQNYGTTKAGSIEIRNYFGNREFFSYPKPSILIKRLLQIGSNSHDIILDFFSGSSTTADAVMQLNSEDGGNRKFIMVQLPEKTDETSEAYKAGYKNICEIGKERIRRAGKKILEENKDKEGIENLDIGFRALKLDDTNMRDVYYSPSEYSQDLLSTLESNVKSDRSDLDLLFGCLLEWGLPLSLPYACEKIGECTVHNYNDGDLIACFDENIAESVIKEIAKKRPLRAVFRDSSFANSPSKINVAEIFKLLAPDTRVKVI